MRTGFNGTFVLTSDQTLIDGKRVMPGEMPRVGQVWKRQGDAIRLDGSQSTLVLGSAVGSDAMRQRVARAVQRRFDLSEPSPAFGDDADDHPHSIIISDGVSRFSLIPVSARNAGKALFWCADGVPLAEHEYRVTNVPQEQTKLRRSGGYAGDVICFTAGTRIRTQDGQKLVETLAVGDQVQTKDNGSQEILWIGQRHVTGARLYAMPELRPIRMRANALDEDIPEGDLLVSPHHRMLYSGRNAQALFNTDEVLISAQNMVNDHSIYVDHSVKDVTYIHLLLADHQVLWANGVATESFHPANTSLQTIDSEQRDGLLEICPEINDDLYAYGPFVRRNLDKSEAAILMHEML